MTTEEDLQLALKLTQDLRSTVKSHGLPRDTHRWQIALNDLQLLEGLIGKVIGMEWRDG